MRVLNVHERDLAAGPDQVGAVLATLASPDDVLWPTADWPAMRFDRPLAVGAVGGHGPIRYTVDAIEPGRAIRFRFTAPAGFDGTHAFDVRRASDGTSVLRHTIDMRVTGRAVLSWNLVFRPLHDALMEDCLTRAEAAVGQTPRPVPWSLWVQLLRSWIAARRRDHPEPREADGR